MGRSSTLPPLGTGSQRYQVIIIWQSVISTHNWFTEAQLNGILHRRMSNRKFTTPEQKVTIKWRHVSHAIVEMDRPEDTVLRGRRRPGGQVRRGWFRVNAVGTHPENPRTLGGQRPPTTTYDHHYSLISATQDSTSR